MINIKNLTVIYNNKTTALDDISLELNNSDFLYLIGKTGSGKSTLLKILGNELTNFTGSVVVNKLDISTLTNKNSFLYKRKIGMIHQDYRLLNSKTVAENIEYAGHILNMDLKQIEDRLKEVLCLVGLQDKKGNLINQLSGGEKQKVAIARAIFNKPSILLADEPTGNLDSISSKEIFSLLQRINKKESTLVICATHNLQLANKFKNKTVLLDKGKIVKKID